MAPLMRASRIAIASFGVSAYELAACGVPAVHLCLTPDHERSSSAFAREDIALTAGVFGAVQPRDVADAAARLIGDARRRMRMAVRARALVDGRGASRIAQVVYALF
jgi:spore coat polysaccharide biosynthesis protein SpsF